MSHSVNLKPRSRRGLFFVGPLTINAGQYPIISSACRPAIAYSRVGTGRTLSAVPSSSNFPASHLGSKLGLIAPSYRAFSSLPLGRPTRLPGQALFCRRRHQPTRTRDLIACQWPRSNSLFMIVCALPTERGSHPEHRFYSTTPSIADFWTNQSRRPHLLAATSGLPPILAPLY